MNGRLKEGGIVSFWLPIYLVTVDETKAILRAFRNVFPNASIWATSDMEWVMVGIKPPVGKPDKELARRLFTDPGSGTDLARAGIELPEQIPALFVMDGEEIDRLTQGVEPLDDFFPKRLSDAQPDMNPIYRLAGSYLLGPAAFQRYSSSSFIHDLWPNEQRESLESLFLIRETRFRAEISGSNWLAELDFYLRHSQLRSPVLEVLNTDVLRVALAERLAAVSPSLPTEAVRDLVAGALAQRDLGTAIRLLEGEKERGFSNVNDAFLLIYLYCHSGRIEEAETLANAQAGSIRKDGFVDWLWGELQAEFGFSPPR
jgi:hypothetical protein